MLISLSITASAQSLNVPDIIIDKDGSANIEINMSGVGNYVSAGFIISLPAGFSLSDCETVVDNHEFRANSLDINSMKVAVYSLSNAAFNNNENGAMNIHVIATGVSSGTYQGVISAVEFATSDAMLTRISDLTFNIEVSSPDYIVGDANGDGVITVADYIAIAHYIMNNPPSEFNEKAADANGDGQINVADYIAVAHIIMNSGGM